MKLNIRQTVPEDLKAVWAIANKSFSDAWSEESLLEEIENPQFVCLSALAEDDRENENALAGYLMALALPGIEVQLCTVAVDPERRRLGIGRALLQVLIGVAAEIKADEITLEVRAANAPALAMYESFGFKKTGLRKGYYDDGEDAVLMGLALTE